LKIHKKADVRFRNMLSGFPKKGGTIWSRLYSDIVHGI
jgi:hypothetical protein